jgi:1-acyl-sn-glycerol-3-phosphate acyltransferase
LNATESEITEDEEVEAVPGPSLSQSLKRGLRIVLISSAFAGFWGGAFLFAWAVLPLVYLFGGRTRVTRTRACQRLVAGAFRVFHGYMRMLNLLEKRVTGEIPRRADGGPVVIIVNHTTLVDSTAIMSAFPHVTTLAKPSIAENFFVGRLLRLCGHISAGSDPVSRGLAMMSMVERLKEGFDVLVFPEGTRSPPGGINPFQRGAFEIACRANVPIVFLKSHCAPSCLTKDRAFWNQPDSLAVLSIEPFRMVEPADFAENSRTLKAHAESAYKEELGLSGPDGREVV